MDETTDKPDEDISDLDLVFYVGEVSRSGYRLITEKLKEYQTKDCKKAYFIPITYGGDPDAGYRISRALGHHYPEGIKVLVPGECKSAGTLMAIGGSELIISDLGELGPLDVQISNKDEIFENSSSLDIVQALVALQNTVANSFRDSLIELKVSAGLGTKLAAKVASRLAASLVEPISAQIDPMRLGEHQRLMQIAIAYGERLNSKFQNTTSENILKLLMDYPSHAFVIDRKEASYLFKNVRPPNKIEQVLAELSIMLCKNHGINPGQRKPNCGIYRVKQLLELYERINGGGDGQIESAAEGVTEQSNSEPEEFQQLTGTTDAPDNLNGGSESQNST